MPMWKWGFMPDSVSRRLHPWDFLVVTGGASWEIVRLTHGPWWLVDATGIPIGVGMLGSLWWFWHWGRLWF